MIPIAKPLMGQAEANAAATAVLSGWVSQGPKVAEFETAFAAMTGAAHACAVSNCTTALHLALLAMDVGPNDEIITVSHSFIAGANAIRQCGAMPVFVDIEAGGYNIDPSLIAAAITTRTRAILCVHQLGMPCDMSEILNVARAHGLAVIEDAACAVGAQIRIGAVWQKIGKPLGDITCFSFHPRKVLTTGEGGMLTTDSPEIDRKLRLWRQHGMSVSDRERHGSAAVIFEEYPVRGYNYRMTDIQAAIGIEQLSRLSQIITRRRALAAGYHQALARMPGVTGPIEPDWARSNWQSYPVRLAPGIDQKRLMQSMLDRGIATRRGVMNMHQEEAQQDVPMPFSLPRSEAARDSAVLLPLYAQMTEVEQGRVLIALEQALADRSHVPQDQKVSGPVPQPATRIGAAELRA